MAYVAASSATSSGPNSNAIGLVNERFALAETLSRDLMDNARNAAENIGKDIEKPGYFTDTDFKPEKAVVDASGIRETIETIDTSAVSTSMMDIVKSISKPNKEVYTWPESYIASFKAAFPNNLVYQTALPSQPSDALPVNVPTTMPVNFNFSLPVAPAYSLPLDPTAKIKDIVPVTAPTLNNIAFDGILPVDNITVPNVSVSGGDAAYSSPLVDNLRSKLNSNITIGGTGLSPTIEAAIYARDQERANLELQATKDRIANEWAKRGFLLPDGVLSSQLLAVDLDFLNKRLDVSRDIAIKQAELEQANIFKSIESAIVIEGQLISYANSTAQRAVEVSKATADALIAVFNANIQKYNSNLEAYKTQAVVFESKMRAELVKVESYKAQVDASRITQEVNVGYVELYKAQLSGVTMLNSLYNAQLEGSKLLLDNEKGKIEANKMQIDLYTAGVNSKVAEYNMYNSQMEGRKSEAQAYSYEVEAYKAKTDNLKLEFTTNLEKDRVMIEENKVKIEEYMSRIDAYKAEIASGQLSADALTKAYGIKSDAVKAQVQALTSIADLDLKVQEVNKQDVLARLKLKFDNLQTNIKVLESLTAMHIEAQKGKASVLAQLGAAALSAVSAGAHVSESNSIGQSVTTIL